MSGEKPRPGDPPHLRQVHARDELGRPICGAMTKLRRDGTRRNNGVCHMGGDRPERLYSNGRCKRHGGPSPGRALTARVDGRRGPLERLREDCARLASEDLVLLDTRPLIERLHSICQRLEDRVEQGDTPELRKRALELFDEATKHSTEGRPQEAGTTLRKLGVLLREGVAAEHALESWAVNLERTAKRIEATLATRIARDRAMTERDIQKILTLWLGMLLDQFDDDPAALRVIASMRTGMELTMGQLYPAEIFGQPVKDR